MGQSVLVVGGIGFAAGLLTAYLLGSEGGEKAVLVGLGVAAGVVIARYGS